MAKRPGLREDKVCLNCGHFVADRYCPHCGQENINRRQDFSYLLGHAVGDFFHYDGKVWNTLKLLLFKPGILTNEYLTGKRKRFVPPVQLYVFISFITFFLIAILPSEKSKPHDLMDRDVTAKTDTLNIPQVMRTADQKMAVSLEDSLKLVRELRKVNSSLSKSKVTIKADSKTKQVEFTLDGAHTMKEYDALLKRNPTPARKAFRPFAAKVFELKDAGYRSDQISKMFVQAFVQNFPKALFIYLPFFAFFLWLVQNKKKFWYFESGIFTLHFFSLLLVLVSITTIFTWLESLPHLHFFKIINGISIVLFYFYSFVYFIKAYKTVYHASISSTIFKGAFLFGINLITFGIIIAGLSAISFLMLD